MSETKSKLENKRYIIITIIAAVVIVSAVAAIRFSNFSSPVQENFTASSYAEQIITDCRNDAECAINALRSMTKGRADTVPVIIKEMLYKYDEYRFPCHETAHHLGMFLYAHIGDLDEALSYAEQQCGGSLYHGVMQNFFESQVFFNNTHPEDIDITTLCPEIQGNEYAIERWQCLHGIGHGLTAAYRYDIFSALQRCEEFEPGWEQISCSKGLFMENMVAHVDRGVGTFEEGDLLFPCTAVDVKYVPPCYHYQTGYIFLKINSNLTIPTQINPNLTTKANLTRTFEVCDEISMKEFVKYCYHGMGRILQSGAGYNYERGLLFCQQGQSEYWADCLQGLVMTLVNGGRNPEHGFEFCKSLPVEFKVDCYDGMGKWVLMLHATPDGRAEECSRAESTEYLEVCMDASLKDITLL